ncbi:hypothetical protein [Streptomyces sp. NPDC058595]|uniref:hypothetical protein n=1 Tax=Streptomyces sp. NPDC058595 TaxID=3346550 RepID=UPI00364D8C5A
MDPPRGAAGRGPEPYDHIHAPRALAARARVRDRVDTPYDVRRDGVRFQAYGCRGWPSCGPASPTWVRASYASRDRRRSGIGVRPGGDPSSWHIEVRFVARRAHRTLEVTRAVREAVLGAVAEAGDSRRTDVTVTVTVTGLV